MKGSLGQRCPADILSEVQRRRMSGVLTLERDRICRQVFVDAGLAARFAASNHPAESLTSLFVLRAGIEASAFRQAMESKPADELLGTALVRLRLMTPTALSSFTRDHILAVTRSALALNVGTWSFEEGALPFRDQLDAGLRTGEILLEWTRGLTDLEWLRRRLGPMEARVARDRRPPEGYQGIRLDPTEGFIMSRVDGTTTIDEICMMSPMGDQKTLAALLGLALAGMLEMPAHAQELPAPGDARAEPPPSETETTHRLRVVQIPAPAAAPAPAAVSPPPMASSPIAPPPVAPAHRAEATTPSAAAGPATAKPVAPRPAPQRPGTTGARGAAAGHLRAVPSHKAPTPRKPPPPPPPPPQQLTAAELEAEMMQRFDVLHTQDLYQVLGVTAGVNVDETRRAYYALARKFHPDRFRNEGVKAKAEKVFARITEAYSTLSNDDLRQRYEQERASKSGSHGGDGPADTTELARQNFRHGREHLERGRLAEALSSFQNACDQDPTKAEYFEHLGLTQARNPRLRKQAEESLQKAIALSPTSASAFAHLGALYERGGMADRAREMYRRALQWDPENAMARKGLEGDEPARRGGILGLFGRR